MERERGMGRVWKHYNQQFVNETGTTLHYKDPSDVLQLTFITYIMTTAFFHIQLNTSVKSDSHPETVNLIVDMK